MLEALIDPVQTQLKIAKMRSGAPRFQPAGQAKEWELAVEHYAWALAQAADLRKQVALPPVEVSP